MSSHHCDLYNGFEKQRWQFTSALGTCIYNIDDELSFIIGWLSVIAWTFALLPQIITNCRNGHAESQSFYFWLLWIIGDICNLSGCILTKNLITNIALATVYFVLTLIAFLQFSIFLIKQNNNKNKNTMKNIMSDDDVNVLSVDSTPHLSHLYRPEACMTPSLRAAINILHLTPRMYALSPGLKAKERKELKIIDLNRGNMIHTASFYDASKYGSLASVSLDGHNNNIQHQNNNNNKNIRNNDQKAISIISPMILPNTVLHQKSDPLPYLPDNKSLSNLFDGLKMQNNDDINFRYSPLLKTNKNNDDGSPLNKNKNKKKYGTMAGISTSIILFMQMHSKQYTKRNLIDETTAEALVLLGIVMGWLASVIYISSRIPQLRLMCKTKNVNGLNPWLFILTFGGNLTQCLSMLINEEIYHDKKDLMSKLPWLLSSGVCMIQDVTILILIWIYSWRNQMKKQEYLKLKTNVLDGIY